MSNNQTTPENPSLKDLRIALTLAPDDTLSPAAELSASGAQVFHYPVAQTLPPDGYDALDAALKRVHSGAATWLLLPTPCAVEAVAARLRSLNLEPNTIKDLSLAIFGTRTKQLAAELLPTWQATIDQHESHADLVNAMHLTGDDLVIVPLAQHSRADWPNLIAATGAEVDSPHAYRLLLGRGGDDLPGLLWGGMIDALIFSTENSVRHFATRLKAEGGTLDMLRDVVVVCLDPATASAAAVFGLDMRVTLSSDAGDGLSSQLQRLPAPG